MSDQIVDGFPDRFKHTCEERGVYQLQGRYMEQAEEYRATCPGCLEIIYWDEDSNTEVYDKEDTCNGCGV